MLKDTERRRPNLASDISWRPYQGPGGEGYATAYPAKSLGSTRDRPPRSMGSATGRRMSVGAPANLNGRQSMQTDIQDGMIIERTTEVSVQYHERQYEDGVLLLHQGARVM